MPERANPFAPPFSGVFLVLVAVFVATGAVDFCSPVRADNACLEQPSQPAAEGTRWIAHYDRAKGRKCWSLVDASTNGHDAAAAHAQPGAVPAPTLTSQLAALLDNLTGAAAIMTPQAIAPHTGAASVPRKGNAANASKTNGSVRADQKSIGEGHSSKRASPALSQSERALFEEFLRWRESNEITGAPDPRPSSR